MEAIQQLVSVGHRRRTTSNSGGSLHSQEKFYQPWTLEIKCLKMMFHIKLHTSDQWPKSVCVCVCVWGGGGGGGGGEGHSPLELRL